MQKGNFENDLTDAAVYLCRFATGAFSFAFVTVSNSCAAAVAALWLFKKAAGDWRTQSLVKWSATRLYRGTSACLPSNDACLPVSGAVVPQFIVSQICNETLAEFEGDLKRVSASAGMYCHALFGIHVFVLPGTLLRSTLTTNSVHPASVTRLYSLSLSPAKEWWI